MHPNHAGDPACGRVIAANGSHPLEKVFRLSFKAAVTLCLQQSHATGLLQNTPRGFCQRASLVAGRVLIAQRLFMLVNVFNCLMHGFPLCRPAYWNDRYSNVLLCSMSILIVVTITLGSDQVFAR